MSWIRLIPLDEATGLLRTLYDRFRGSWGDVDHILKVHGLHPEALERHYELYRTLMFGRSPLSRAQREMIGVVVSRANDCHY